MLPLRQHFEPRVKMKFNIVAGRRAKKEERNLSRKCGRGDSDQRFPESTIRRPLRFRASERRTGGRLTQARLPMKRNSTPRETPTVYIQLRWDGVENCPCKKIELDMEVLWKGQEANGEAGPTRRTPVLLDCVDVAARRENRPAVETLHGGEARQADLPTLRLWFRRAYRRARIA